MTVCDDPVPDTRRDAPIRRTRSDRPHTAPPTATSPPTGDPRSAPRRFSATWLLAALLGVVTFGSLPSAVPVKTAMLRAGHEATPRTDGPSPGEPHPDGLLSALGRLLPGNSEPPPPGAEPAPALQLRPAEFTSSLPDDRAVIAVQTAMAQIGLPYEWGGNGPANGDPGFDCSGLTTFSYAAAGIMLPRTAQTQYLAGPHVTEGAPLQPGDLVFYGVPGSVHHVGMYIGDGRMVNAPTFGKPVQTAYYRWRGDDYLGATRPAATGAPTPGLLPYAPPPVRPTLPLSPPPVFDAPPAPLPPGALPVPGNDLPPEPDTAAAAIAASDVAARTPGAAPLDAPATPGRPGAAPDTGAGVQATAPPGTTDPFAAADPRTEPAGSGSGPADGAAGDAPGGPVSSSAASGRGAPAAAPPSHPSMTPTADPSAPGAPPRGTTAPPAASTTAPPSAAPVTATAATLPGGTVELTPVEQRPTGVPGVPAAGGGVWSRDGRTAISLGSGAPVDDVAEGSPITVRYSDGSTRTFTVRSRTSATTAAAAELLAGAPRGGLVVLAAAGPGNWIVLTAT